LWSKRRWLYGSYMLIAVMRIPARTGFHLNGPACDMRLTLHNVQLSLTKIPHVVLFGVFFLITVLQFDRADRRTMTWSLVATLALGVLVELEEGMTRTGNCRITDVLPDLWGAFVVMALVMGIAIVRSRTGRAPREQ
jgi:VanZ family protein